MGLYFEENEIQILKEYEEKSILLALRNNLKSDLLKRCFTENEFIFNTNLGVNISL